ncbi:MAG: hypothetical protein Q8Q06_04175 [bacterium]|nr:hypothetical protein [bacterium]
MLEVVTGPLKIVWHLLSSYWWAVAPFLFGFGAYISWMSFKQQEYLASLKWVLLEIKPPPDVEKSPKIAENIFSGLHTAYISPKTWKARFFKGEVQDWFSFEIVGINSEMRFYVRTLEGYKDLVQNLIFSQYSEAEIKEVPDYIDILPKYLPDDEYDIWGTELVFTKPDAYPIKTYPEFEEESGGREAETKRTDPLSPLAEQISTLEPGEFILLQLTLRSTGGAWVKDAQVEIDKMLGKEVKIEPDFLTKTADAVAGGLAAILPGGGATAEPKREERKEEPNPMKLTSGQRKVLEAVENKLAKLGFKAGYRFIYVGRKETFHRSHISGIVGMFKQLYSNNLNSFKPNSLTMTHSRGWMPWLFPSDKGFRADSIIYSKKRKLFHDYRSRAFVKKFVMLNTEELATLWHLPGAGIKAPLFPRVEAKKGQPPAGLPMK